MSMTFIRKSSALLILAGIVLLAVSWRLGTQHWVTVHTGSLNTSGSPPNYNFWSGFGSDIGEYTVAAGIFGHIAVVWRVNTCHRYWWCWRSPHFALEGSPYKLCGVHHPDDVPTVAQAIQAYQQQKAAAS